MIFYIKHNTSNYIKGGLKLWVIKVLRRIFPHRKNLTFILLIIGFLAFVFSYTVFILYIFFVLIILILDLIIYTFYLYRIKIEINSYIANSGGNIELITDSHKVNFKQYSREFQNTNWIDVKEIYIIKNPNLISFKNKITKYEFILFENEFEANFNDFLTEVINKSFVTPLINQVSKSDHSKKIGVKESE